ncbi:MAG: hypothetical protein DBY37_04005 [Desulfovibrionaceae bacterium]|nr:MAG: hypothetical protein DBY37_04005 [Desulfovibrionaceae bacterium]
MPSCRGKAAFPPWTPLGLGLPRTFRRSGKPCGKTCAGEPDALTPVLREPQETGHPGAERSEARPWASVVTPEHLRLACGCSGGVKPAGRKQARPAEIFNGRML